MGGIASCLALSVCECACCCACSCCKKEVFNALRRKTCTKTIVLQLLPILFRMSTNASPDRPKKIHKLEETENFRSAKFAIHPYLYFNGNATEAIDFYAAVFDAKITAKMTFKDGPPGGPDMKDLEDKIMHAMLKFGDNAILISDNSPFHMTSPGSNVQLNISMSDLSEMEKVFASLAENGIVEMPLEKQFWGATYGKLIDRFGIHWGLNCEEKQKDENK